MTDDLLINMLAARQIDTAAIAIGAGHPKLRSEPAGDVRQPRAMGPRTVALRMPTDAATRKRIAGAKSQDQLIQVLTDSHITLTRSKNRLDTAGIPHDIYGRITALAPGEPFIIPVGDGAIANSIVSREPHLWRAMSASPSRLPHFAITRGRSWSRTGSRRCGKRQKSNIRKAMRRPRNSRAGD